MSISCQANIVALKAVSKLTSLSKSKLPYHFDLNKEISFTKHIQDTPEKQPNIEVRSHLEFQCTQEIAEML